MKKRNLKSLNLNKSSISNLRESVLNGGKSVLTIGTLISIIDGPGCMSEAGCTGGTDQTMTCPLWSCHGCTGDK